MKKLILILFFNLLFIHQFFSQPSISWQRCYVVNNANETYANAVCNADNGNFYIGGGISGNPHGHNYVIKINPWSDTVWTSEIRGSFVMAIAMMKDSSCLMTGGDNLYSVRLDKNGNVIWNKTYDSLNSLIGYNIKILNDSNILICGVNNINIYTYILKLNSRGDIIWSKNYGGEFSFADTTNDGNYIFAGSSYSGGLILKLDTTGNYIWENNYLVNNYITGIYYIKRVDNYYFIAGSLNDGLAESPFIAKVDFDGNLFWSKIYKYSRGDVALGHIKMINPNRFVSYFDYLQSDTTQLIVIDSVGNILHANFVICNNCGIEDLQQANNGDIVFVGLADFGYATHYVYAIRTDSNLYYPPNFIGIHNMNQDVVKSFQLSQNYPNPFNPTTKIKFSLPLIKGAGGMDTKLIIFDLLGSEVATLVNEGLQPGTYEVEWNATNFASGIYFYRLETGDFTQIKKMVLLK